MEIYTLQELFVTLDKVLQLLAKQLLERLELLGTGLEVERNRVVEEGIAEVEHISGSSQQSIQFVIQHLPLLVIAHLFGHQLLKYF